MTPYRDLRDFVNLLEARGELIRVKARVSPDLEISEIADRISKKMGPALFFESVEGSEMPVLINLFGSWRRTALALGMEKFDQLSGRLGDLLDESLLSAGWGQKIAFALEHRYLANVKPRTVRTAPCQEIINHHPDLNRLPILKCWPGDASRFITMPMVITRDPHTRKRNVGMYRMQVLDSKTTAMHWQTQKDGALHEIRSRKAQKKLEVAVAIGADPASVFSAIVPLPHGLDELLFSGFIRKSPVECVKCVTVDLEVPAHSEIVLEGWVDPEDLRPEGPFGDHTGVYTPVEMFPVFHVECITTRRQPWYLTTLVGKPPMEDYYMGKAVERIFLPVLQKQIPELKDMNFPLAGTFNNAVIASIDKEYPFQARKLAHAVWGLGQLAYTKFVIIVDSDVDVHDLSAVSLAVFNHVDPKRDIFFVEGPVDTLNHAAPIRDFGSKAGVDATRKTKEEGYARVWPEEIQMTAEVRDKVSKRWTEYGL